MTTQTDYEQKEQESWEDLLSLGDCIPSAKECFDYAFSAGYDLGKQETKQEKDSKEVSIDKEEYENLCKCRRYVANWHSVTVCPICGEYNPSACQIKRS